MASQPDLAAASVGQGKPEIAHLRIDLFDLCFFRPERRVFRGSGLNPDHGEVFGIDPDSAAVQKLVVGSGFDGKNVGWASGHGLEPGQRESVVVLIEGYATLVLLGERFFLRLQHSFEYSVNDELGAMFGADAEILGSRRAVLHLHNHLGASRRRGSRDIQGDKLEFPGRRQARGRVPDFSRPFWLRFLPRSSGAALQAGPRARLTTGLASNPIRSDRLQSARNVVSWIVPRSATIPLTISEECSNFEQIVLFAGILRNPSACSFQQCSIVTREYFGCQSSDQYDHATVSEMRWRSRDGVPSQRKWPGSPSPGVVARPNAKWRCSTCGNSYTAEELRADNRAN